MNVVKFKAKVRHEVNELLTVVVFLAPFLLSFAIFRHYLEGACGTPFSYGAALATAFVNAYVLAKVILIGEVARIGKRSEDKPLMVSTVYKAAIFALFYLIIHVLEAAVRSVLHGEATASALRSAINPKELMAFFLVVFFAFIPFIALREIRRTIGAEEFRSLFLGRRTLLEK